VMKRVGALHAGEPELDAETLIPFLGAAEPVVVRPLSEAGDRAAILDAYRRANGNKSRVAEILGVSRKTLYARLKRLGLELE